MISIGRSIANDGSDESDIDESQEANPRNKSSIGEAQQRGRRQHSDMEIGAAHDVPHLLQVSHYLDPSEKPQLSIADIKQKYLSLNTDQVRCLSILQIYSLRYIYTYGYTKNGNFDVERLIFKSKHVTDVIGSNDILIQIAKTLKHTWHNLLDNHIVNQNFFDTIIFVMSSTILQVSILGRDRDTERLRRSNVIPIARSYLSKSPYVLRDKSAFKEAYLDCMDTTIGFGHFFNDESKWKLPPFDLIQKKNISLSSIFDGGELQQTKPQKKTNAKRQNKKEEIPEDITGFPEGDLNDENSYQLATYKRGASVFAFYNPSRIWFPAKIHQRLIDGTYIIKWDDGDQADTIKSANEIRIPSEESDSEKDESQERHGQSEDADAQVHDAVPDDGTAGDSQGEEDKDASDSESVEESIPYVADDLLDEFTKARTAVTNQRWIDDDDISKSGIPQIKHSIKQKMTEQNLKLTFPMKYVLYHMQQECLKALIPCKIIVKAGFKHFNVNHHVINLLKSKFDSFKSTFDCMDDTTLIAFNQLWPFIIALANENDFESIAIFTLTRLVFELEERGIPPNDNRNRIAFHLLCARVKLHNSWNALNDFEKKAVFENLKNTQLSVKKGFYYLTQFPTAPSQETYVQWWMCIQPHKEIKEMSNTLLDYQQNIVTYVRSKVLKDRWWTPFNNSELTKAAISIITAQTTNKKELQAFRAEHLGGAISSSLKQLRICCYTQNDPIGACIILILQYLFTIMRDDIFQAQWEFICANVGKPLHFYQLWHNYEEGNAQRNRVGMFAFYRPSAFTRPSGDALKGVSSYLSEIVHLDASQSKFLIELQYAILKFQQLHLTKENIYINGPLSSKLVQLILESPWYSQNRVKLIDVSNKLADHWINLITPSEIEPPISAVIFYQVKAVLSNLVSDTIGADGNIQLYGYDKYEWYDALQMNTFFQTYSEAYRNLYFKILIDDDKDPNVYTVAVGFNTTVGRSTRREWDIPNIKFLLPIEGGPPIEISEAIASGVSSPGRRKRSQEEAGGGGGARVPRKK